MSAADEFPIGSQWRWRFGKDLRTVLGSVVTMDGAEWVIVLYPDCPTPQVVSVAIAREFWTRVLPEPKFKPGDKVTWGTGVNAYEVLASWLHPTTGDTYMVTTLDPDRAEWIKNRGWRLAEDGAA